MIRTVRLLVVCSIAVTHRPRLGFVRQEAGAGCTAAAPSAGRHARAATASAPSADRYRRRHRRR